MKQIKTLFFLTFILIAAGCESSDESSPSGEQPMAVAGYELEPMDLSRIVRASATVEAENVITVASHLEGLITSLHVREGDRVQSGDTLLTFDTQELRAELSRAQAQLELAEAAFSRAEQLFDRNTISRADFEESRANLQSAESEVNLLETRLSFGTMRAGQTLTVLNRYVEEGDAVSINEPLLRVANTDRLVARIGIPERDFVYLNQGQPVEVQIDAYPGETIDGTIQRLYPSSNENSRLFTVEVRIPAATESGKTIRPGFLARIMTYADRRPEVLAIPSESLLASEENDRFVYIINEENRIERRDVATGIERRNWTEILDGLQAGDVIIGANPATLRENLLVNVSRWIENDSSEGAGR